MRDTIQISAVIPTYNREQTIGRAIVSVLAQEYPASEIIVVDDGSKDDTQKNVESYGGKVRYVYQENGGVSAARNCGVREAKCEWIAFLDSDDYWVPDHLRRMANAIEATQGEAALYFSDTQRPSNEGGYFHWELCGFRINSAFQFKQDAGDWAIMRIQPMMFQSSVIRRSSYLEIGGLPEHLRTREDTYLFFMLGFHYPACAVSGCGAVMTSDDNIRLTHVYDGGSLSYQNASIFLFKKLLANANGLNRERRKVLTDSLSGSYYSIGRIFFRQNKYLIAFKNLAISGFISPSLFIKAFLGSLGRRVLKKEKRSLRLV